MGFLKHFRSKSRLRDQAPAYLQSEFHGEDLISQLPDGLLEIVFGRVCPHSLDVSYAKSEDSSVSDGCMLCDLRDLSNCAQVCRRWEPLAQGLLYNSVRIDAVHYCELEEALAERREKKYTELDTPGQRLRLFERSVRSNRQLAAHVHLLKLPYMTRETCRADLARTISVLPNLRYVDLPDGFFSGEATSHTLREELIASCPDIRKMTYAHGSEHAFSSLLQHRHWTGLEAIELSRIALDPPTLRYVLASLLVLHELKAEKLPWFDDSIFSSTAGLPDLPPLKTLILEDIPAVTSDGLLAYLSRAEVRESLTHLSLHDTGVNMSQLPAVLWKAPNLCHLSIREEVKRAMQFEPYQRLSSFSLRTLYFEISEPETPSPPTAPFKPTDSYYSYLAQSLLGNGLPALSSLYVLDANFAETLLVHQRPPAPPSPRRSSPNPSPSRSSPLAIPTFSPPPQPFPHRQQTLEVYTRGPDELAWVSTAVTPLANTAGLGPPQWGGNDARRSVMVANGQGGFLAVPSPSPEPSPGLSPPRMDYFGGASRDRKSRGDLWR